MKFNYLYKINLFKYLSLIFLSIFFIGAQNVSASTINKPTNYLGLIGYWTFDGKDMTPNVRDISGQGNHGTLLGQSATTTTIGKFGQALLLDASDDRVKITNNIGDNMAQITVSYWMKSNVTTNPGYMVSKGRFGGATLTSWHFVRSSGGEFQFSVYSPTDTLGAATKSGYADTNWHHVVGTYDGATVNIYVDGVAGTSGALTGLIDSNSGYPLCIGSINGDSSATCQTSTFNGILDEVRLYNRALSANEVKGLYNSASTKFNKTNTSLNNGLIGHWTFDGKDMTPNVRDISGQGNHGTLSGQSATTTSIGKFGQALRLDGSDDFVTMTDFADNMPTISAMAWVKISGGSSNMIISKSRSGFGTWSISYSNTSRTYSCRIFTTDDNRTANSETFSAASHPGIDGKWHHVMCIYDGANISIYVDGAPSGTPGALTGSLNNTSYPFCIGTDSNATTCVAGSSLNGLIDDVRIYNRALSANEITALYNSASTKFNKPNTNLTNGLIGHWTFDGKDMTPNVRDISGQGNHATISGQSATTTAIGKIGQALGFDGSNDYVDIPDIIEGLSQVTFSTWVKVNDVSGTTLYIVEQSGASSDPIQIDYAAGTGGNVNKYKCSIQTDLPASTNTALNTPQYFDKDWHHIVCTYDGSNVRLYIDGAFTGTANAITGNLVSTTNNLVIGADSGTWNGSLDDFRIYNRALTATEIQALYNGGK
jgi:hypothetical protein